MQKKRIEEVKYLITKQKKLTFRLHRHRALIDLIQRIFLFGMKEHQMWLSTTGQKMQEAHFSYEKNRN